MLLRLPLVQLLQLELLLQELLFSCWHLQVFHFYIFQHQLEFLFLRLQSFNVECEQEIQVKDNTVGSIKRKDY